MTKPDLTSELNSLLGYMSVATLSQGKVKQLSFVWLSPGTEERRSDFRARSNLLLKISGQQHCLPADLDWRCLDGKNWMALDGWISFHRIAMWSEQAKVWARFGCFVNQSSNAAHIWTESSVNISG